MTEHHVQHIKDYLKSQGFTDFELMDDLTDHLATEIEFSMDSEKLDFETSFENAKQKLLPDSPYQLERDLKILTTPKHNIMIKKIAYLGGFLSTIGISLALLFIVLSFQNETKADGRQQIMESEELMYTIATKESREKEKVSQVYQDFSNETARLKLLALDQQSTSQTLMIITILIFITTYLPYRFYDGYNKSQLELTA
ncbi:MAG: hypothetical protein JJ978_13675 [Roseivirga sp.]|jgi:hypothetical protein|uniref:hypothetical protein n=1 Tax=Roseivirga sp. TaxID=1964215 RepID=UPI001B13F5BA|nr:hypothetical protein [Roseivirga sp.]MBO6496616.1 hypothetical protein [Roseivirga sp.]